MKEDFIFKYPFVKTRQIIYFMKQFFLLYLSTTKIVIINIQSLEQDVNVLYSIQEICDEFCKLLFIKLELRNNLDDSCVLN